MNAFEAGLVRAIMDADPVEHGPDLSLYCGDVFGCSRCNANSTSFKYQYACLIRLAFCQTPT